LSFLSGRNRFVGLSMQLGGGVTSGVGIHYSQKGGGSGKKKKKKVKRGKKVKKTLTTHD